MRKVTWLRYSTAAEIGKTDMADDFEAYIGNLGKCSVNFVGQRRPVSVRVGTFARSFSGSEKNLMKNTFFNKNSKTNFIKYDILYSATLFCGKTFGNI